MSSDSLTGAASITDRLVQKKTKSVLLEDEVERYHELGLGRGVNVTDPKMWKNKNSFLVRRVNSDLTNVVGTEESGVLTSYEKEVSTFSMQQQKLRIAVSDTFSSVKIGLDEHFSRSTFSTKQIIGQKIEERTISFHFHTDDIPLYNDAEKATVTPPKKFLSDQKSIFEGSLYFFILKRMNDRKRKIDIPDSETTPNPSGSEATPNTSGSETTPKASGSETTPNTTGSETTPNTSGSKTTSNSSDSDPNLDSSITVENAIVELNKELQAILVLDKKEQERQLKVLEEDCAHFIKKLGLTHYVSSVKLGACHYQEISSKSVNNQLGVGASVDAGSGGSATLSGKLSKQWRLRTAEQQKIGRIDIKNETVEKEAVIGFQIQPLHKLVRIQLLQMFLQDAILKYIQEKEDGIEGPYLILCEMSKPSVAVENPIEQSQPTPAVENQQSQPTLESSAQSSPAATPTDSSASVPSTDLVPQAVYWRVNKNSELCGTENVEDASLFYILPVGDSNHPSDFHIAVWDGEERKTAQDVNNIFRKSDDRKNCGPSLPRYLTADCMFGRSDGPLKFNTVVETKNARFALYSRFQSSFAYLACFSAPSVSTKEWIEGETFFIKCSRHWAKFDGFIKMSKNDSEASTSQYSSAVVRKATTSNDRVNGMLFRLQSKSVMKKKDKPGNSSAAGSDI